MFFLLEIIIYTVLAALKVTLHCFDHSDNLIRSLLILVKATLTFFGSIVQNSEVSSANRYGSVSRSFIMSLT